MSFTRPSGPTGGRRLGEEPMSALTKRLIEDGLAPKVAAPEGLDHLADARREASCIALDIRDAAGSSGAKCLQHIRDAIGRAHQLIHQLKAAEAEAKGRAA